MCSKAVTHPASAPLEDSTGASHVAEAGVRVEMMKIESDPNFALPVAMPFQSTVQSPYPENGASVTGISSPTLDRRVPHPGNARRPLFFDTGAGEVRGRSEDFATVMYCAHS